LQVRVPSDPNLILRLLKELRGMVDGLSKSVDEVKVRLTNIENTMGGMASHLFAISNIVRNHEGRLRKLETRPAK
jgi:hypothetical protein